MEGIGFFRSFHVVYKKDSRQLLRSSASLFSALLFAVLLAALYRYAFSQVSFAQMQHLGGALLASLLLANHLLSSQSFRSEQEAGALHIMNMSSLDPAGVYCAKLLSHWQCQLLFLFLCLPTYLFF